MDAASFAAQRNQQIADNALRAIQMLMQGKQYQQERQWQQGQFDYKKQQDAIDNERQAAQSAALTDYYKAASARQSAPDVVKPPSKSDFQTKVEYYIRQGMSPVEAGRAAQGDFPKRPGEVKPEKPDKPDKPTDYDKKIGAITKYAIANKLDPDKVIYDYLTKTQDPSLLDQYMAGGAPGVGGTSPAPTAGAIPVGQIRYSASTKRRQKWDGKNWVDIK